MSEAQPRQGLPSTIPLQRGDETLMSGSSAIAALLLFAILIAVWIGARRTRARARGEGARRLGLWKAVGGRRDASLVNVVESRRLSSHSVLHVVDYEGRRLLLADGVRGVQCLVDDSHEAEHPGRAEATDVA